MATAIKNAGENPTLGESVTKALNSLKQLDGTIYGTVRFDNGQLKPKRASSMSPGPPTASSPNGSRVRPMPRDLHIPTRRGRVSD